VRPGRAEAERRGAAFQGSHRPGKHTSAGQILAQIAEIAEKKIENSRNRKLFPIFA
jgi:translation elongation factor EF-1alpha